MKNKMSVDRLCVEVQCDRDDAATQSIVSSFYPYTCNRIKTSFKLSIHWLPELLEELRGITQETIDAAPPAIRRAYWQELNSRWNVSDLLINGPRESAVVSDRLTLMPHQQLGRELAKYESRFAFFYDTRTGKTPLSLSIIYDDITVNPENKWLVVCPLILIENAWLPDAREFFPDIQTINCHGTPAYRKQAFKKDANIYLINTESFVRNKELIYAAGFHGCIVDESSAMKSPKSQVSKELVEFAQHMHRFYLLAGTPAPNGEYEYYMQMKAIDYFGWHQSYAKFKEYYFVNLSYNPQFEKLSVRPDRKDELTLNIKKRALYIDKDDVLDLPGREFHEIEIEMPKELKKHYNTLKNELYLELGEDFKITAPHAGAKINKLNQVSSGFIMDTLAKKDNKIYGTDNAEWHLLSDWRFKELLALLKDITPNKEQVLIWANYRKEFEIIKELLGDSCRCVYGATGIEEKNSALRDFKAGKFQYLVANPASADKGLTLTNTHLCVYFSINASYELFKQSYDRIYGSKSIQPHFCHYYILIAKGTIDRVLYSSVLKGKSTASYEVLNHLKSGE